jgi:hypothetical protein
MDVATWIAEQKKCLKEGKDITFMVKLKPHGYSNTIKDVLLDNKTLKVSVTPPPQENKANKALISLLADHIGVPKTSIKIIQGLHSTIKVITISAEK